MQIQWYGQSTFRLVEGDASVVIDPFDLAAITAYGRRWDYPALDGVTADLLLVTHEHADHNGVEAVGGDPATLRSTAGTHDSPIGAVTGVASEHDEVAGTERGPNTIFVFALGGLRVAHLGDLGQRELRPEQTAAIGTVDVLFVPVGGHATIGAEAATDVVANLSPRVIIPMHYRTERIDFLEPADDFLARARTVRRLETPAFEVADVLGEDGPVVAVPAAP
ncbi:MAG: putative Zn-dependent hydrolase [Conexibacter sp.]|nr:putative Zn-dependent hydrolase [Conexibacter sp.]